MELHMDPHLYYGAWNLLAYQFGWATRVGLNTVGTYPLAYSSVGYVCSPQRVLGTMEQALLQPLMAMDLLLQGKLLAMGLAPDLAMTLE